MGTVLHELAAGLRACLDRRAVFCALSWHLGRALGGETRVWLRHPTLHGLIDANARVDDAGYATMAPEDSAATRAFRTGVAVLVDEPPALAAPLRGASRPIGALAVTRAAGLPGFVEADRMLLEAAAELASLALEASENAPETSAAMERARANEAVLREIATSHDLAMIAERTLPLVTTLLGGDRGAFWLIEDGRKRCIASQGLSQTYLDTSRHDAAWPTASLHMLRPVLVRDLARTNHVELREAARREGLGSALLIPLSCRSQLLGVLAVYAGEPHAMAEQDLSVAAALGQKLGVAVMNTQLVGETRRQLSRLGALREISRAAVEAADLGGRCDRGVGAIVRTREADHAVVMLVDAPGLWLVRTAQAGADAGMPERLALSIDGMFTRALAGARVVSTEDVDTPDQTRQHMRERRLPFGVAVPMVHGGQVLGVLGAARAAGPFSADTIAFLRAAADQLAGVCQLARVFDENESARATLGAVLESLPDGVLVLGTDERVLFCNAAFQRLYGLEGRDLTGWSHEDFRREVRPLFADQRQSQEIERQIREEPRQVHRIEYEVVRPTRRVVERISAPVLDDGGQLLGQVVLYYDVTARRVSSSRG